MTKSPLVSIITPSLNQGSFIKSTIESVLTQDYPNVEYIVMDGGSTDNTINILKEYGDRFVWRSEADLGQSDAINNGLRMAKGEIVTWLNSDDYFLPGAISRVVEFFQKESGASTVYGNIRLENPAGDDLGYSPEPFFDLWKMIHMYNFIPQPSTFFKRDAILAVGLLDTSLHYLMDWELWIRLAKVGKVASIPDMLSCARVYPAAKTYAGGFKRWLEVIKCAKKYGSLKLPPSIFLELPLNYQVTGILKTKDGKYPFILKDIARLAKNILLPRNFGVDSGAYWDGYMSSKSFLSVPVVPDADYLGITTEDSVGLQVSVDDGIIENQGSNTIKLPLNSKLRRNEFIHLKFTSSSQKQIPPSSLYNYSRKVAFKIIDIKYVAKNGDIIDTVGLPNFI